MNLKLLKQTYDRVNAIVQCRDADTIADLGDQLARSVGASSHALVDYGLRGDGGLRVLTASPHSRFAQAYAATGMDKADPIPPALQRLRHPVTSETVFGEPREGLTALTNFLLEAGIRDFIVVPIFQSSRVVAGLGFQFARHATHVSEPGLLPSAGFVAGLAGPALLEQVDRIKGSPGDRNSAGNPLTPRELECLIWSADGKTSWEISEILEVSERTVNAHLGRVIRKLGVVSRTQAVAEAFRRGFFG
jgi:LuxR family quorum sensing-dependent transcriptional regulator